jgi:hypothetical protein
MNQHYPLLSQITQQANRNKSALPSHNDFQHKTLNNSGHYPDSYTKENLCDHLLNKAGRVFL